MRILRLIWAGLTGFIIDDFLTSLLVVPIIQSLNFQPDYVNLYDLKYVGAALILPMLSTALGGAFAGRFAPEDAGKSGALVGGLGVLLMLMLPLSSWESRAQFRVLAVAQVLATLLAILAATLVGRRTLRRRAQS